MQLLRIPSGVRRVFRDLFFGMFFYGLYQQVIHTKVKYENMFYALLITEFLGFPMTGNYYTLKILPYIAADLDKYRRRLLRETDLLELLHEGPGVH